MKDLDHEHGKSGLTIPTPMPDLRRRGTDERSLELVLLPELLLPAGRSLRLRRCMALLSVGPGGLLLCCNECAEDACTICGRPLCLAHLSSEGGRVQQAGQESTLPPCCESCLSLNGAEGAVLRFVRRVWNTR